MRHLADGESFQTPSTIEDPQVLSEIDQRISQELDVDPQDRQGLGD